MKDWNIGLGHEPRAIYASDPKASRGRLFAEPDSPTRTAFQRDRDRIIHSTAFRRLLHKTQVFVAGEDDHFRTRLTHSIEVGQIARGLARALRLDEDLTEAIALVHDFGHTPFGHAGERSLDRISRFYGGQGFDHNAQALRIVTRLERNYAGFDGLNLTWETLEGLVKHNGPVAASEIGSDLFDLDRSLALQLGVWPSAEAQCAAIADDVAYCAHDIDDGLRSGLLTIDGLRQVAIIGGLIGEIEARHGTLERGRMAYEIVRRQITLMVEDILATSQQAIAREKPLHADDFRRDDRALIDFSPAMATEKDALKAYLFRALYRNPQVIQKMERAETIVSELFEAYARSPERLPPDWHHRYDVADPGEKTLILADFLAGMTDGYAMKCHARLFDRKSDLF